jgi:hypothetical protein
MESTAQRRIASLRNHLSYKEETNSQFLSQENTNGEKGFLKKVLITKTEPSFEGTFSPTSWKEQQ